MKRPVTFYGLKTCDTCRKAKKYLQEKGVIFQERAIRETPPSREELLRWIDPERLRSHLNTSSEDYRRLDLSKRTLTVAEALDLIEATLSTRRRDFKPAFYASGQFSFHTVKSVSQWASRLEPSHATCFANNTSQFQSVMYESPETTRRDGSEARVLLSPANDR